MFLVYKERIFPISSFPKNHRSKPTIENEKKIIVTHNERVRKLPIISSQQNTSTMVRGCNSDSFTYECANFGYILSQMGKIKIFSSKKNISNRTNRLKSGQSLYL